MKASVRFDEWFWRVRAFLPWTHAHAEYLTILERLRFR